MNRFLSRLTKHPDSVALALLMIAILLPFWKLALVKGVLITDASFTSDMMNGRLPERFAVSEALKSGTLPLWAPQIYGGFPMMAWAEAGVCYPINILLFGLLPLYTAFNWDILLTLLIAGAGMLLYLRGINVNRTAAFLASFAFAYSGPIIAHLQHLSMINSACWFPWGLWTIDRCFRETSAIRASKLLWLAPVIAMQFLAGHPQMVYYSTLLYFGYVLNRWFGLPRASRSTLFPYLVRFVLAVVIGAGIAAIQLFPTYELAGLSQRSQGISVEYATALSYDPTDIKMFLSPFANGEWGNATYRGRGVFWEDYSYMGAVPLFLAFGAALFLFRRDRDVRLFTFAALLAFLMVLGTSTPFFTTAFYVVPGMKYFRCPMRFLFFVDFALCALASIAISHICASRRSLHVFFYALTALTIVDLTYFQMRLNPIIDRELWEKPPRIVAELKAEPGSFRVYSPFVTATHRAAFEAAGGWKGDLSPYLLQREFLQPDSNLLFGISTPSGYAEIAPVSVTGIWGDSNFVRGGLIARTATRSADELKIQPGFLKLINLFGVRTILSSLPIHDTRLEEVNRIAKTIVYRNPSALPRVFLVGKYRLATNPLSARITLISDDFDPSREAVLYQAPPFAPNAELSANASLVLDGRNELIVKVRSSAAALLILADTFYPGWKAEVDGSPVPILKANVCQRGIAVTAGDHDVRFFFDPLSVKIGLAVSLLSIVLLAVLLFLLQRS